MNASQKKSPLVAAIHDLSGFGRCSLSVILPCLSAMGIQVCAVPTAVLSTHTGGFEPAGIDMTAYLPQALKHYQALGLDFLSIYSGYLNSEQQVECCLDFFRAFPKAWKVVDPVMGDNGKAYSVCTPALQKQMRRLAGKADMITPNITEAAMLLGESYPENALTAMQTKDWLTRLGKLGPAHVVITGAPLADGSVANLGYEKQTGTYWRVNINYLPGQYPGTGDIYCSILVGAMLSGACLPEAMELATRFLELAVESTYRSGTEPRYGVQIERHLETLIHPVFGDQYEIF